MSNASSMKSFWQRATAPSAALDDDQRQKMYNIIVLNLIILLLVSFVTLSDAVIDSLSGESFQLVGPPLIAIPLVLTGYLLGRSKYYLVAAYWSLAIPTVTVAFLLLTATVPDPGEVITILNYMILSIIASGLFLDVRGTVITGIFTILIAIATFSLTQPAGTSLPPNFVVFMIAVTGTVAAINRLKDQYLEQLQTTQAELLELNETLEQRVDERTIELKAARDEALAARRIADENSRLKSEFLATMSHELRTPMNAIEGFTGIILARMGGAEYNEKTGRYLEKIKSNSKRLLGLINDFLDLSRIESGRYELADLPVKLQALANQWHQNLSVLAEKKGLDFVLHVDPNLPATVYGDEESLSKIVVNLVGNAVKFTEEGSVTLSLENHGSELLLQITDTGIGIPPHAREFIFEEFRQVDQSSKRQHGGTGLGLAIVQRLTREMGGTITLESEVGSGSTFTVQIPIRTEQSVVEGVVQ